MNVLIGDIGNTNTKICIIEFRTLKIEKLIYFNSKNICSKNFLKNTLKKIIKKKTYKKIALFSSVVPRYQLILKKFLKKTYRIKLREIKEKNIKKIIKIGNTIIDSADISYKIAEKEKIKPLSKEKFALISVHRHENIKNKERLKKIVKILMSLKIESYFTLHDNTKKQLIKFNLYEKLKQNKNIKIIETLEYIDFIYQLKNCSLIICDGGSLQEESLIFKKPCIILRKATERQECLETNFQFLSKLDVRKTKEKINEFLDEKFKVKDLKNPYGELGLSKKIIDVLR